MVAGRGIRRVRGAAGRVLVTASVMAAVFVATPGAHADGVAAPTVTAVSPSVGGTEGGTSIIITGTDFDASATVTVGGNSCTDVAATTTSITCTTPAHTAAPVDIEVTNPDTQTGTLTEGYRYAALEFYAWGLDFMGEVGDYGSLVMRQVPTEANALGRTFTKFVGGLMFSCGVGLDHLAYCWGSNSSGQLGTISADDSAVPVAVQASDPGDALYGKTVVDLTAGLNFACALTSEGKVYCWGDNYYGQLGNGTSGNASGVPVAVDTSDALLGKTVTRLSAGYFHVCAVTSDGKVYCWGDGEHGWLGNNGERPSAVPVAVNTSGVLAGKTVTRVSASSVHTCVTTTSGEAFCWGENGGSLGNGLEALSLVPVAVSMAGDLNGKFITDITTGIIHTCALTSDGLLFCWGKNTHGSLGTGGPSSDVALAPEPVIMNGDLSGKTVTGIIGGWEHTCAFTTESLLYCWGYNGTGTIGNDSTDDVYEPTAVDVSGALDGKQILEVFATGGDTFVIAVGAAPTPPPSGNPTVTSVSPGSGPIAGGTSITVTGTGFATTGTVSVTVGGTACTSVSVSSAASLSCTTPAHVAGGVAVEVTNPDTKSGSKAAAFTYVAAPEVTSLLPDSGPTAGGTSVTITGSGFAVLGTVGVKVGGSACTDVLVASATSLSCTTPAHAAGAVTVEVTNPDTQTGSKESAFTFVAAPTVTSVSPSSGALLGGTSISVAGTGFATSGTVSVKVGGTACTSVSVTSSSLLSCTTPAHAAGAVTVEVTNPDTQAGSKSSAYTYAAAPTVSGVLPASGRASGGTSITVSGTGFATSGTVTVSVGGSSCASVSVSSESSLTCTTTSGTAGYATVQVTNPDTQAGSKVYAYRYVPAPTITSLSPSAGPANLDNVITVEGTGFATSGTVSVTVRGLACTGVMVQSSTSLLCLAPANTVGSADVVVTNPDGQSVTKAAGYAYLNAGEFALYLVREAAGYTPAGDKLLGDIYKMMDNKGNCDADYAKLESDVDALVKKGKLDFLDGVYLKTALALACFDTAVLPPSPSSVKPAAGRPAGGDTVTISGFGFATRGTVSVTIGGVACTGVQVANAQKLTCKTGAHAAGTVDVTVRNPDGQSFTLPNGYVYSSLVAQIRTLLGTSAAANSLVADVVAIVDNRGKCAADVNTFNADVDALVRQKKLFAADALSLKSGASALCAPAAPVLRAARSTTAKVQAVTALSKARRQRAERQAAARQRRRRNRR